MEVLHNGVLIAGKEAETIKGDAGGVLAIYSTKEGTAFSVNGSNKRISHGMMSAVGLGGSSAEVMGQIVADLLIMTLTNNEDKEDFQDFLISIVEHVISNVGTLKIIYGLEDQEITTFVEPFLKAINNYEGMRTRYRMKLAIAMA